MKPLIFYVKNPEESSEEITITRTRLEDMISQAYEAGRKDGNASCAQPITTITANDSIDVAAYRRAEANTLRA